MTRLRLLGKSSGFGGRTRVYETESAIEVDEIGWSEILRSRVFFDEVLLMTYHRFRGVAFPLVMGFGVLVLGVIALVLAQSKVIAGAIFFGLFAFPFLVALILRLALGVDIITIQGKRTRAHLRFAFAKGRARRTFEELERVIRFHQEEVAAKVAAQKPPPPTDPLPPPAPSEGEIPPLT